MFSPNHEETSMTRTLAVLAFVIGCGTDGSTEPPGDCTPGEALACDCSPQSTGTMTCGADGTFGACGMCSDPDPDPQVVNFQAQVVPILNRSCGTGANGCHPREAYGAAQNNGCRGWLALENAPLGAQFYAGSMEGQSTGCPDRTLHERLLEIDVWQCLNTPTAYVAPGNPGASYIMNKLNGLNMCKEMASSISEKMPPPQPENPTPFTITQSEIALIEQWITEGALDN